MKGMVLPTDLKPKSKKKDWRGKVYSVFYSKIFRIC